MGDDYGSLHTADTRPMQGLAGKTASGTKISEDHSKSDRATMVAWCGNTAYFACAGSVVMQ